MILEDFKFPVPAQFEPKEADSQNKLSALCIAVQVVRELAVYGYCGGSSMVRICVDGRFTKYSSVGRMFSRIVEKGKGWKVGKVTPAILADKTIVELIPRVSAKGKALKTSVRG